MASGGGVYPRRRLPFDPLSVAAFHFHRIVSIFREKKNKKKTRSVVGPRPDVCGPALNAPPNLPWVLIGF